MVLSHRGDMLGGLQNGVNEIEPDLVDFSEVSSVQAGIGNSLGSLPLPLTIYEFSDDLFEIWALLELLIRCAVSYCFESQELGDGPFPKRDPSPPDVACQVLSIAKISVELFQ